MLHRPAPRPQRQRDRQPRHKVDVADIRKHLRRIERELAKAKVHLRVGVARVEHRRLDERGAAARAARVEEEGEAVRAAREPDAPAGDRGDGASGGVFWGAEGDGAVDGEGLEDFGGGGGEVERAGVGLEEDAFALVRARGEGEARDVGEDGEGGVGGGVVDEVDS